jgi:hypothetical protein
MHTKQEMNSSVSINPASLVADPPPPPPERKKATLAAEDQSHATTPTRAASSQNQLKNYEKNPKYRCLCGIGL